MLAAQLFGALDQLAGNRDGSHLAAGNLLTLCDGLAVHQSEDGDVAEGVDRIDQIGPHADKPALMGHDPSLALQRRPGFQAGARQSRRQPASRLVFMQVARLELDEMNLACLPHAVEMPRPEDSPLAKIRPKVVNENAPFYI